MLGAQALGRLALGEGEVSTATQLIASAGSYAITWRSALGALSMPAAAGAYTLSGKALTDTAYTLTAAVGSYAITWRTAVGALSMPAAAGAYTLSGQSAVSGSTIAASVGSFALE